MVLFLLYAFGIMMRILVTRIGWFLIAAIMLPGFTVYA